jgi:threonylcarbamoyladenosine tRNA methylthiotransferase MtaB
MKYAVVTFGCRVNQADSLAIEGQFLARGAMGSTPADADVVVVNTCSVTASADQAARQTIRRIVRANPAVRVIVTGCYASREPADVQALPNVIRVVENSDKERLVDFAARGTDLPTGLRFGDGDGPCGALAPGVAGRTAFTLRVQTGCDQVCSYCIIPATRGAGRSRRLDEVAHDIERAIAAGYREIALTGVHLGSYGRDLREPASLSALVRLLADWPADVLFRLSSLEPMDCTPEIVAMAAASPRIAPHFHLPLQHGSDEMLRAMRRPYQVADYVRLVEGLHRSLPHASIGSDIIVGFPGETSAHFSEMCEVLERLPLTHLHVFPYSDRPGTEASGAFPKVNGAAIRERGRVVRAIGDRMNRRFRAAQSGSVRRALVVDDGWSAVTDNYVKVRLETQHPRNTWAHVQIA